MWLEYAQICNHFHLYNKTAYYLKHLENTADWISKDHRVVPGMNRECYYQAKAKMFENTNRLDSAIVFYKRGLASTDLDFLHDSSRSLCRIYLKKGNVDSLKKYQAIYEKYKQRHESTHNGYSLQRKQIEFNESRQAKARAARMWKIAFVVVAGISLLLIVLCLMVWFYRRRRGKVDVKSASGRLDELRNVCKDAAVFDSQDNTCQCVVDYYQCEAVWGLRNMAEQQKSVALTSPLWEELMTFVHKEDTCFGDFLDGLQKRERRTGKKVICLCLLIRAGFTLTEISCLLGGNASGTCNMRARLARKVFNDEKAVAKHLDEYIRGIP